MSAPTVLHTVAEAREYSARFARQGLRLALVPTMGFLHEGHLSLMREGKKRADAVAVSIFVNPTQFGPQEDFSRYPQDLEGDLAKCASAGVEAVFAPQSAEVYPPGHQTFVEVSGVSQRLDGERRPGHFRGVATVVTKLLCLLRPTVALFGEKDYQQLQVIKALCADLDLGVEVVGLPIIREPDGLAMSSRNVYLSSDERPRALALYRGLCAAQRLAKGGERGARALIAAARSELSRADLREDYVEVVDAQSLAPIETLTPQRPARALIAAFAGKTRLIDNGPL